MAIIGTEKKRANVVNDVEEMNLIVVVANEK